MVLKPGERLWLKGKGPALIVDVMAADTLVVAIVAGGQLRFTVIPADAEGLEAYGWPDLLEQQRQLVLAKPGGATGERIQDSRGA